MQEDALKAWSQFFNHSYWDELSESTQRRNTTESNALRFNDTEQFIDDLYPVYEQYDVSIDCEVSGNGFSVMPIEKFFDKLPPQIKIIFHIISLFDVGLEALIVLLMTRFFGRFEISVLKLRNVTV